ncbi:pullulanase [Halobacillus karajensis]|uniref:pullulanase n=1 Tax=Halobacillus karajensis TaxID=195088 RepID=A0A024P0Q9_9BACI|nr:pullulanase [Halobacillus karajensis]CDQ19396.1 Pullulanase precursor [Halobacillus karajensis]CDQ21859.1 Pullulanase precursor [Halobacillus karajensis]CDQ27699.1 Pullulanase precursor [Halobacillus karajensis]
MDIWKNWRKVVISFIVVFMLVVPGGFSWISETETSAETNETVTINYKRLDGNYEGWGLHLWNQDKNNPAIEQGTDWNRPIEFTKETNYGVAAEVPVIDIQNGLNFIVHKGDEKDTPSDRSFPVTGEKEFWLVQGDSRVYVDEPVLSPHVKAAKITNEKLVSLTMNQIIEDVDHTDFELKGADGEVVSIHRAESDGQEIVLHTEEALDLTQTYILHFEEKKTNVYVDWQLMDDKFAYDGELGATLHENGTATLKLWSPTATNVSVVLYDKDNQYQVVKEDIAMKKGDNGVWSVTLDEKNTNLSDLNKYYYQYRIEAYGEEKTALDPYAKSMAASNDEDQDDVGKAAIVDPSDMGPKLKDAKIKNYEKREDAIIWEAHVRDFTSDPSIEGELNSQFGTFNAFVERLDYIKELGVTHVQLLPVMKYYFGNEWENGVREREYSASGNNYNWGYDPHSYFSLSGMYSELPQDPGERIREFKRLVNEIHKRKMGVILDVVYNHTAKVSILEDLVPNYYHYMDDEGKVKVSYGGGRVGTTHEMSRKLMVDSIKYWVEEFKVDGFRFDLMGDLDAESVQLAYEEAKAINPDILMLGEGWRTYDGDTGAEEVKPADQDWMNETDGAAVFSDEIRNELKSGFGSEGEPRFITGGARSIQTIFNTIKGQPENVTEDDPGDIVQYIAAHDNLTLHDVIAQSIQKDPSHHEEEIQKRIRLGNSMILTSQGISFLHAGQEYGRTKQWKGEGVPEDKWTYMEDEHGKAFEHPYFIHDSYDSTDVINQFDWKSVLEPSLQKETMEYTKGLIELRRWTDAFRHGSEALVNEHVTMLEAPEVQDTDLLIAYKAVDPGGKGKGSYYVFVNADNKERTLTVSDDLRKGKVLVDNDEAGRRKVEEPSGFEWNKGQVTIDPLTTIVIQTK